MRNILCIGAYERDNFGDSLFFEVAKRLFPEDNIIPGSIKLSSEKLTNSTYTIPFDFVLKNYKVDLVWVVGGEVGGVDSISSLKMSLPMSTQTLYLNNRLDMASVASMLSIAKSTPFAYLPDIERYDLNKTTPLIINSVGIAFAKSIEVDRIISKAEYISVRDNKSLKSLPANINAKLHPDVVSSISEVYTPRTKKSDYFLVQSNKANIDQVGENIFIEELVRALSVKSQKNIILVAAGTAPQHDDTEQLARIAKSLKNKGFNAAYNTNRSPLSIVDTIYGASLVIATSLHMRIVADSYSVPVISLKNEKVTNYVKTWNSGLPYDVDIRQLSEVVASLKPNKPNDYIIKSINENISELKALITKIPESKKVTKDSTLLAEYAEDYINASIHEHITSQQLMDELNKAIKQQQAEIERVTQDKVFLKNELKMVHAQMKNIINSKAFSYMVRLRTIKQKLTGRKVV